MTITPAQILELPAFTVAAGTPLVRIHRSGRGAWHFSRGPGRFDPVAAGAQVGACYTADDELTAFVETYRRTATLSESDLHERRLSALRVSRDLVLIDLTARGAALRGPDTSALSSGWDYAAAQTFASIAVNAGMGGVRYFARHDPAKRLICNAIFGRADDPALKSSTSGPLPDRLLQRAREEFGYRIVPVP